MSLATSHEGPTDGIFPITMGLTNLDISEYARKLGIENFRGVFMRGPLFKERRVLAIWTADLGDMQSFSRSNKGFKYILMIIDVFSKCEWAIPLETKTGPEVDERPTGEEQCAVAFN